MYKAVVAAWIACLASLCPAGEGNRLAYLDESAPYYVSLDFPRLTTPQWFGEEGVELAVILSIDDMRDVGHYENYLRPILERLKKIDGRAPLSIMTNSIPPGEPHLQTWLSEGLSLETHTIDHPCPLLSGNDFPRAKSTFDRCVDLLTTVEGNLPVAFRMPCMDSLNTPSPRFFAEIFNRVTPGGNFLTIDSSICNIPTAADPELARQLLVDGDGRPSGDQGPVCASRRPLPPIDVDGQHLEAGVGPHITNRDPGGKLRRPACGDDVQEGKDARADNRPPQPQPAVFAVLVRHRLREDIRPPAKQAVGEALVESPQQENGAESVHRSNKEEVRGHRLSPCESHALTEL